MTLMITKRKQPKWMKKASQSLYSGSTPSATKGLKNSYITHFFLFLSFFFCVNSNQLIFSLLKLNNRLESHWLKFYIGGIEGKRDSPQLFTNNEVTFFDWFFFSKKKRLNFRFAHPNGSYSYSGSYLDRGTVWKERWKSTSMIREKIIKLLSFRKCATTQRKGGFYICSLPRISGKNKVMQINKGIN